MHTPQKHHLARPRSDGLSFLHTELGTGLVFSKIALMAGDGDKISRNRENARKAYKSARRFMTRIPLSADDSFALHQKLQELERRLRALDEGS